MEESSSVPQCTVGQDRRAGTEKEEEEEEEDTRPLGCGQAQRTAGEEDRSAEEGREGEKWTEGQEMRPNEGC